MGIKDLIKKSVAMFSAVAITFSMIAMPTVPVFAEDNNTDSDPLQLRKSAQLQQDGTYKITLESWAKGEVTITNTTKPCDIVLVLDQSGSMSREFGGTDRQAALKEAATNFINNVATNARENKVDHKIAMVTFASKDEQKVISGGKTTTDAFVPLYSASNANQNTTGKNSLTNSINSLPSADNVSGATAIDQGIGLANSMIPNNNDQSRNRIVITFTDGYPTYSNSFQIGVANNAIEASKSLKDRGAKMYTIGIFNGADVNELYGSSNGNIGSQWKEGDFISGYDETEGQDAAANRFLNYVSSNFNDATALGLEREKGFWGLYYNYKITNNFDRNSDKYYMSASNQSELNNIFETISNEIGNTSVELDETAVIRDVISEEFDLSESNNIKVFTSNYLGNDSWGEKKIFNTTPTIEGKTINISGFDYKENYVAEAATSTGNPRGKKLVIEISGITAKHFGENMDTNEATSGIYKDSTLVKPFNKPNVTISSKSYVLDYGKTVSTAASDYGLNAVTIANTGKPSPYNINLSGTYGKFNISNGSLNYTPGKINWDGFDTGYVFGEKSAKEQGKDDYKWEAVNFIPATSVYYEDDFGTDENKDSNVSIVWAGKWDKTGNSQDEQQSSSNSQYGWDDSYTNDTEYSNGSTHVSSTKGATATFTFTGTGVDIYSRTDNIVGKVYAKLSGTTKDNEEVTINKGLIVDNNSASGTYYQIPTLSFDDLEYGTYTVKITVMTTSTSGNGTYYLDGIRVYNPLGTVESESTEGKAYEEAGESNAQYIQVRKNLLDSGFETINESTKGSVFIDKLQTTTGDTTSIIGTYKDYGPKNEVYIASKQGIAFNISNYDASKNKVFIGLKAPSSEPTTVKVTDGTITKDLTINSASDLYYTIKPDSKGNVVIENTGNELLSITKVRITTSNSATNQSYTLMATPELMSYVEKFATLSVEQDKTEDTILDKDDVTIKNPSEDTNSVNNKSNQETKPSTSNSILKQILNSIKNWFSKR